MRATFLCIFFAYYKVEKLIIYYFDENHATSTYTSLGIKMYVAIRLGA